MGLIDQIIQRLLQPLIDRVKRWLGPFGRLLDEFVNGYRHLVSLRDRANKLVRSVISEIDAWRTFHQNFAWRTRVINLRAAYDQTRELLDEFVAAGHAVRDLWLDLERTIKGAPEPEELSEEVAGAIESPEGIEGLARLFPKLAKVGEKILGVVAIVVQGLEGLSDAVDDIQGIVDTARALREEIEFGSTIFLQQGNRRRVVRTVDGDSIKIRLGNLHS